MPYQKVKEILPVTFAMAHGITLPFDMADVQLQAYDSEIEHLRLTQAIRAHISALPDQPGPMTLLEYTAICPGLIRFLGCARWQHDPTTSCTGVLRPEFLYHDGRVSWMPRMVLCRQHQRLLAHPWLRLGSHRAPCLERNGPLPPYLGPGTDLLC